MPYLSILPFIMLIIGIVLYYVDTPEKDDNVWKSLVLSIIMLNTFSLTTMLP